MVTAGIIAEYNPFHNGHLYQITDIRDRAHADQIIVVMSGDFTQRGTPAMLDKYARTRMALCGGADLVLELPFLYAAGSAERFAQGGVGSLSSTGICDCLCFGAESDDLPLLEKLSAVLAEEPEEYRIALRALLKSGSSFPSAREQALMRVSGVIPEGVTAPQIHKILSMPNNILALEYVKQLQLQHSSMKPFVTLRHGDGYHEPEARTGYASATAIRNLLEKGKGQVISRSEMIEGLKPALPQYTARTCCGNMHRLIFPEVLTPYLNYRLFRGKEDPTSLDCDPELSNRIFRLADRCTGYEDFILQVKNKSVTHSHISRAMLHLLLGITAEEAALADGPVPYLRILGFRKESAPLLSELRKNSSVPIIAKPSDWEKILDQERARKMFRTDVRAAAFYEMLLRTQTGQEEPKELTHSPIIL